MVAIVPGARPAKPQTLVAEFAPAAATRVELMPRVERLMVQQRLALTPRLSLP